MSDAQVVRILIFILALIFSICLVRARSWENKWERFWFRFFYVAALIKGIEWLAFDILGLFPLE